MAQQLLERSARDWGVELEMRLRRRHRSSFRVERLAVNFRARRRVDEVRRLGPVPRTIRRDRGAEYEAMAAVRRSRVGSAKGSEGRAPVGSKS